MPVSFQEKPAHTACNQLSVLTQKDDEELEEFAERALRLFYGCME